MAGDCDGVEVTGADSDRQVEGREAPPASVSSTAPPARGYSAASAGPTAVQPRGENTSICSSSYFYFRKKGLTERL